MSCIIIENAFSKEQCQQLILNFRDKTISLKDLDYSVYHRFDFRDKDLAEKFNVITKNKCSDRFFFTKYTEGGFIKSHQDGHVRIMRNSLSTHTVLLYLNNDYEGGELVIEDLNLTVKPNQGTVIVMDQTLNHYVNMVTKGEKYILRTDTSK